VAPHSGLRVASVEGAANIGLWVGGACSALGRNPQKALVAAGLAAGLGGVFRAPIRWRFFAFEGSRARIPGGPSLRAVLCGQ